MSVTGTCKECGARDVFFGPAAIVFLGEPGEPDDTYQYVNCRRCGAMLLVGRDGVEVSDDAVR